MTELRRGARVAMSERTIALGAVMVLSVVFAALVMTDGVPALRHDWTWPVAPDQIRRFFIDTWSGWSAAGIGSPAPYPSSYLLAVPISALLVLVGSTASLYVFLFVVSLTVGLGAHSLVNRFGASFAAAGIAAFAMFNPWVYTEVVAGHVIMVWAYGATMFLLAMLLDDEIRWKRLFAALAVMFGQLQFFLIGLLLTLTRLRDSGARRAWLLGIVIFLPTIAGILAAWHSLSSTPYTLAWQQSQSVAPLDAALFTGYFAGYTQGIELPARIAAAAALAAALAGLAVALRSSREVRRGAIAIAILGIAAGLIATGTKGPLAGPYSFAMQTLPATGLFRELFDLLGYVAIAYVALAAYAARHPLTAILSAIAGGAALLCWFIVPPASFFVSRDDVPKISISAAPGTRFSLYPAFQPMAYQGRGSGLDPDAYIRTGAIAPLNTIVFQYPESIALLQYQESGSMAMLGDLSVSTIAVRPWLQTRDASLRAQLGAAAPAHRPQKGVSRIAFLPQLALTAPPTLSTVPGSLRDAAVFFGDPGAAALSKQTMPLVSSVPPDNTGVDPASGWVDARLTFLAHPQAAQPFGGVATSSPAAVLRVRRPVSLLVLADGYLRTNAGAVLAAHTRGYRWTPLLSASGAGLYCAGFCVVAAAASAIPPRARVTRTPQYTAVAFNAMFPWLATATLQPAANEQTLRYNTRYNRGWLAFADGKRLAHVELDSVVNAWLLPPDSRPRSLVLVEGVAALQTLFELLGCVLVAAVPIGVIIRRVRAGSA